MTLNPDQRRLLAYLRDYLNKPIPSERKLAEEFGKPRSTIGSMLGSLDRWGLIETEVSGLWGSHKRVKILRYWRDAPAEEPGRASVEEPRKPSAEDRQAALEQGTRR